VASLESTVLSNMAQYINNFVTTCIRQQT